MARALALAVVPPTLLVVRVPLARRLRASAESPWCTAARCRGVAVVQGARQPQASGTHLFQPRP